jgi:hypothetical protein
VSAAFVVAAWCGCSTSSLEFEPPDGGPDSSIPPDGSMKPPTPPVPPGPPELGAICGAIPKTLADWERCLVKRKCEVQAHCGGAAYFSSVQECVELSDGVSGGQLSFDAAERARSLASGRARLNVAAFTECLVGLTTERCALGWHAAACERLFDGTTPDLGACYADSDCASAGAHCVPGNCGASCCAGTCEPRRRLGQTCQGLDRKSVV